MSKAIFNRLGVTSGMGGSGDGNKPIDPTLIKLEDKRKKNPISGQPFKTGQNKSLSVNPDVIKQIIAQAKAKGIDPYTALAISYQESGLDNKNPFNLNPDFFGKSFGNPEEGIKSIMKQMDYAKNLQKTGVIPQGEDFMLQGYNGYGKIKKGHQDLEGATSIYGVPIPAEGFDFRKNPLYGKTVMSLRDEILKQNPQISDLVNTTPAYKQPMAPPTFDNMQAPALSNFYTGKL